MVAPCPRQAGCLMLIHLIDYGIDYCIDYLVKVGYLVLEPPVMAFRAFFLYNRMPYDRTIFSKLRDPWTLLLTYIAASPTVWVRGSFFTIYLICIASER